MTEMIAPLIAEVKQIKALMLEKEVISEQEFAEKFPMFNTFLMIPDGMLENPMVQSMINNMMPKG